MFSHETDLTLDSIMMGKRTTHNLEERLDREVLKIFNTQLDDDVKVSSLAMYLGEDHNFRTQMYVEITEFENGGGVCERCGIQFSIFIHSHYSLCQKCNLELEEQINEVSL